jgi:ABC-type polysaccharide/polyol phosphate export permease
MYLTPVIYPAEIIPQAYRFWMFTFNPMYYFIESFRLPVYAGQIPPASILITGSTISVVMLLIGWIVFTWKANELTYRT